MRMCPTHPTPVCCIALCFEVVGGRGLERVRDFDASSGLCLVLLGTGQGRTDWRFSSGNARRRKNLVSVWVNLFVGILRESLNYKEVEHKK